MLEFLQFATTLGAAFATLLAAFVAFRLLRVPHDLSAAVGLMALGEAVGLGVVFAFSVVTTVPTIVSRWGPWGDMSLRWIALCAQMATTWYMLYRFRTIRDG